MTVRSRAPLAHGDRPAMALSGPSPALHALSQRPNQPPPPPTSFPANFTPAFIGLLPHAPRISGSGDPDPATRRLASVVVVPPPSTRSGPARPDTIGLHLDTPSPTACEEISGALLAWRAAGCPAAATDAAPAGILRAPAASSARVRSCKTVSFAIPTPRICGPVSPPPRLHSVSATSPSPASATPAHILRSPSSPAPGSRCSSTEMGWTLVQSRRTQRAAPRQDRPSAERGSRPASERELAYKRRTWGRCFRCLERGHRVRHCRNPLRCLSCNHFGHRARNCTAPPPASSQPGFVATSSGLRREGDCRSWSAVASGAVPPTAPALPARPHAEPRHVADALCQEFDFRVHEDIATTRLLRDGVDGALAEENECVRPRQLTEQGETRLLMEGVDGALMEKMVPVGPLLMEKMVPVGPLLLTEQGEDKHCEEVESCEYEPQLPEVAGVVRPSPEPFTEQQAEEPIQETMATYDAWHAVALATPAIAAEVVTFDSNAGVLDTDEEAAALGCHLVDDAGDADAAGILASDIALRGVAALFSLPAVPLLPTPLLPTPRAPVDPPAPDRRSSRLAKKPLLHAEDKAVRLLHKKMGLDVGDMPLEKARKEFANSLKKNPLSGSAIDALTTLFRLNLPSMTAADEALVALAGPGGCELEVSV